MQTTNDEVAAAVAVAAQAGFPTLVWGPPGEGKTSMVHAVGTALARPVEVVIGSIRDATDFGGLPVRTDRGVDLAAPGWAWRIVERAERGQPSILVLDELTTSPPAVQAAMLRVVLDRVVGDLALPVGTAVVAAANPPELAAEGYDLAAPLANRFCHLDWLADPVTWTDGLLAGWPTPPVPVLPSSWRSHVPMWRARVAGLIRKHPTLLRKLPADEEQRGRAWPSPRSWTTAAELAAASSASAASDEVTTTLLAGCIGEGATAELLTWIADEDLPDPEEVLADPTCLPTGARGDRLFAALGAVVAAVSAELTEARWQSAWAVLGEAAEHDRVDVAAAVAPSLLLLRQTAWTIPPALDHFAPVLRRLELR